MPVVRFLERLKKANRERLAKRSAFAKLRYEISLRNSCKSSPIKIKVGAAQPIEFHFRPESAGDRGVIVQMFAHRDYDLRQWEQGRLLLALAKRYADAGMESLIIDAGANIGGSAVFFHQMIPGAKLICVEPDPGNCRICKLNILGTHSILLESAISSVNGQVKLLDTDYGDWGFRTMELSNEGGLVVPAINIETILELYAGGSQPLVVKIDIEGAESDLFQGDCEWMGLFPCIIIELHDWMLPRERSSANFLKQVSSRNFDFLYRGENIFLFNMKLIDEKIASFS